MMTMKAGGARLTAVHNALDNVQREILRGGDIRTVIGLIVRARNLLQNAGSVGASDLVMAISILRDARDPFEAKHHVLTKYISPTIARVEAALDRVGSQTTGPSAKMKASPALLRAATRIEDALAAERADRPDAAMYALIQALNSGKAVLGRAHPDCLLLDKVIDALGIGHVIRPDTVAQLQAMAIRWRAGETSIKIGPSVPRILAPTEQAGLYFGYALAVLEKKGFEYRKEAVNALRVAMSFMERSDIEGMSRYIRIVNGMIALLSRGGSLTSAQLNWLHRMADRWRG